MHINIRIEVTPGSARRIAYIALTLLVACLATVAYAVPVTFTNGQKLTAEQLNQNFGDLDAKVIALTTALESKAEKSPALVISEWQKYVPELRTEKNTVVRGQTSSGYYRRVGDSLEATVVASFTVAPETGALWWQFTVPDGLTIDFEKVGEVGDSTVGGGIAQSPTENVALVSYVRSKIGVSAIANGANTIFLNDKVPFEFGGETFVSLYFTVPIVQWGTPK